MFTLSKLKVIKRFVDNVNYRSFSYTDVSCRFSGNYAYKMLELTMIIEGTDSSVLHKSICYGYSKESPKQGSSNEYPEHTVLWR